MPKEDGAERLTITVEEAGKRLGIGRNQAYEAVARHEIPSIRIGKRILVPIAAFNRLLESAGLGRGPEPADLVRE